MKTFKEITLISISTVLTFGGFGLILTANLLNGIMLIGAVMVVAGISIFIILARNAMVEK